MSIRLSANGSEGNSNWKYVGAGQLGEADFVGSSRFVYLPVPNYNVLSAASRSMMASVVQDFNSQKHEIFDHYPDATDAMARGSAMYSMVSAFAGRSYNYNAFKFCFLNDPNDQYMRIYYKNGPNSIQSTTGVYIIDITETNLPEDVVLINNIQMSTGAIDKNWFVQQSSLGTVFTTEQACIDYLNGSQVDPSGEDDPGSSYGNNHTITPSNTYSSVTGTVLSELTVVAELDNQNLGYIGAALNNQIDIGNDVATNLNKIVRGIVQGNIADGIMSVKTIPIPSNGSVPYRTGTTETLFEPMGSYTVAGKKLDKTIEKYEIGRMHIERIFNDYRDFMTEYSIYLPFSGIHKLDADIIVDADIILRVDIDFICGSLLYHISVNDTETQRDIYQFTGDCAVEIPITAKDYSEKYAALMNGIFSGVGMTAGVAAGSPFAAISAGGAGLQTLGNAAMQKPNYIQSGKLIPNASAMSVTAPYLIISTPQEKTPNINHLKGRPCHKVKTLNNCSGFTVATQVDLSGILYATDEDKEEIRALLSAGVYM